MEGGGGPGSQLSRLRGVDPCGERDMQGQEPPPWGGASEKAGPRCPFAVAGACGAECLRFWEGRLSSLSQGYQHWPPEVRPWAGPCVWDSQGSGPGPRGRGVPRVRVGAMGGAEGLVSREGRSQWPPMCPVGWVGWDWTVGGGPSVASHGDSWRWLFRRSLRGCQSQHQCRPHLWFCALHGDETTEETVLGSGSTGISSPGSCASHGS